MSASDKPIMLAELCDLVGVQCSPSDVPDAVYLGLEHLAPGRMRNIGFGRGADAQSHKFMFQHGDVLYGKLRPYLDKAILADGAGVCTTELLVLRPKPGVVPGYLACVVHDPAFMEHAIAGVTGAHHPRTSWNHISAFTIPRRNEDEQHAIARALWTVHDLVQACERSTDAALQLKQAAMRELFTRGLRGETQKETEIGLLPESWSFERLGEIAEIAYGAQAAVANATDPSIGTLILTNVNLDLNGHIDLEKRRYYRVPDKHKARLSLRKGDVLFNWRSGSADHVGKTVYFDLDGDFTYSSFILRFRPHRSVTSKYLFRWLTYLRVHGFFTGHRNVSSINSVYNASLSATIPIWFPEGPEQDEIVGVLDALDREIELHRRKRAVVEDLFKCLLHGLMTGEVRVDQLDLSSLRSTTPEAAACARSRSAKRAPSSSRW